MTMRDMKCDVCGVNPPLGVASTSIPYSCAYCQECATRGADPEGVFEYLFQSIKEGDLAIEDVRDNLVTYKDGKYISFKEWSEAHDR
jgi:hypothetical protein